jgi:hypothetical protein
MLVKRNPIMPERFQDENDENMHIQHVKINKPDFDVRDSAKTFTTVEDIDTPAAFVRKGSNFQ